MTLYTLFVTLAIYSAKTNGQPPVATSMDNVPGFTTQQACENAKVVVLAGKQNLDQHATVMTAVCLPDSV